MKDNLNKQCKKKNCKGHYKETSIHDDWEGVLHCSICDLEVKRWIK